MKITLRELHWTGRPTIDKLGEQKPKSAKLAYKLSRIVAAARPELDLMETAERDLLLKYGTLVDPENGRWNITPETSPEFEEQWNGLHSTEIELWGDPIKIDSLDGDLDLTVNDYSKLGWLFTDED
jgi:hypothetical protein